MRAKPALISIEDWKNTGDYFDYRGHPVFYKTAGDKESPALLLIHGFPSASWDWNALWEQLKAHFFLISLDMMGYGFSPKPVDYDYSIMDQADLFESICHHLGVSQAHLLAHDYGDSVAQELMARHGEGKGITLNSAVLLNGGLFPETHHPVLLQKLLLSPLGPLVAKLSSFKRFKQNFDNICHIKLAEEDLMTYWDLLTRNGGMQIMPKLIRYMNERKEHRERWVGALQHSSLPIVLVDGLEDPVSGKHMVERYRQLIDQPKVVELEGVGHYPQVEAPERVLKACLAFWRAQNVIE